MAPPPVRVLQLVTRMNIGGPARHVLHLAKHLGERFDVRVAAGMPPADEGLLSDASVAVTPVELVRAIDPRRDGRALQQVRRLLRRDGIDVLHTHMAKAGSVGRVAASSLRHRPRTVHTFHGHVLEGYFDRRVERAFLAAERSLARRTDALVAVSTEIRDALYGLGIGRDDQWHVIRPSSDLAPFFAVTPTTDGETRRQHGIPADAFLIAVLGRLAPIKDHATLLHGVAASPAHLLVCGEGPLEAELRQLAAELGAGARVHFHGWTADVPELLREVDAVALTSRNEGTPLALVEAQATGLPVVATDVGGVRDVVAPDETGLLVRPGDVAGVAEALETLAADPVLRQRLGQAGRARMRERYSPTATADAVADLYLDLMQRPAQGRSGRVSR